jgi:LysR family glycine cleavage system transcriptional activator
MFRLPSLQSLRFFESAARLNSFTKAAAENGVSQGAVSQHIKSIEVRVGFEVFSRERRSVILTESGQELLNSLINNLSNIQRTIELERRKQQSNELIISVLPGFAIRWLFPRLMSFNARYPEIKIEVNTVSQPLDFNLYHAHAGIAYRENKDKNNSITPLFSEDMFPVCSKKFASDHHLSLPLAGDKLCQMQNLPLLADQVPATSSYPDTWSCWQQQLGLDSFNAKNYFSSQSQSNVTLQLAELGHGIAIGRTSLVMDALDSGVLVALSKDKVVNPCHYFISGNPAIVRSKALQLFEQWLIESCVQITEHEL